MCGGTGELVGDTQRRPGTGYYVGQISLSRAIAKAVDLREVAATGDTAAVRASLDAWCEVGRRAIDARHEYAKLRPVSESA
jgi:hypothetical protein